MCRTRTRRQAHDGKGGRRMATSLPAGYYIERDPDVLVLRAEGGRFVAAFCAPWAAEGAAREAAWDDVRAASAGATRTS